MVDGKRLTRRSALGLVATGTFVAASETFGFSNTTATRGSSIDVVADSDAYVGMLVSDQVKKNQQETLVNLTNNFDQTIDATVSLNDCTQGTLYAPDGSSGCSVTVTLSPGASKTVDIEAAVSGVDVFFTVDVTGPDFSFQATRSTSAVSGNTEGAVTIDKVQKFSANANQNDWTIQTVEATFNDNFSDRVEYEVTDSAGNVVGTYTDNVGDTYTYSRKGQGNDPAITIQPDDGYTIQPGETYELTVIAWDVLDNFATETRTDTA
ncbi:hypothetical protein BRC81_07525 [Halobacteriales archaeon QS_1_68_20]|nr:MAG: hypothetical protein BRC81_07525 [Halobacteriales archaeon QS_1_68_20]